MSNPIKEEEIKVDDIRMMRPGAVFEKTTSIRVTFQQTEHFEINKCKISFFTPNVVALFINISDRELNKSIKLYKELFDKKLEPEKKYDLPKEQLSLLYDYFENIKTSVIAMYSAVESFSNIAIPEDYVENKVNNKGVTEIWDKTAIERWYSTSEKIGNLLPKILNVESPKSNLFWSEFKQLENLRNNIIHPKVSKRKDEAIESSYLQDLLQENVFEFIKSGYKLIKYYCEKDEAHNYFPIGIGRTLVKPVTVENFSDFFTIVPNDESSA